MDLELYDIQCTFFEGYSIYRAQEEKRQRQRTVTQYELEYFVKSEGGVITDGDYIPFEAGSMCIRTPGQVVQGINPYNCYAVRFQVYPKGSLGPFPSKLPSSVACGFREDLIKTYENSLIRDTLSQLDAKARLYRLVTEVCRVSPGCVPAPADSASVLDCIRYIQNHLAEPLTIGRLMRYTSLSKSQFHKQFFDATGATPMDFVTGLRIDRAKNLLRITDQRIADVAAQCGFLDQAYFTYVFRTRTGLTPLKYRQTIRTDTAVE